MNITGSSVTTYTVTLGDTQVPMTQDEVRALYTVLGNLLGGTKTVGSAKRGTGGETSAIRSWARSQGMPVSDRGRLAPEVLTAYQEAHAG